MDAHSTICKPYAPFSDMLHSQHAINRQTRQLAMKVVGGNMFHPQKPNHATNFFAEPSF
jgi:hypothetical protein